MALITGPTSLGVSLLALLMALPIAVLSDTSIWTFDIDEGPAPSPAQRPPFSAGARYDPSLLKYQIPGLVGGYVGFVLAIGFCVLTFGRRLRKEALASTSMSMEMVKPLKQTLDPSPVSPSSTTLMWQKWGSRKGTPSLKSDESPLQPSIVSFDDKVVEKDRAQRQDEMERLYAAVMAQNVRAPHTITHPDRSLKTSPQKSPSHTRTLSSSSRNFSQPHPSPRYESPPTSFEPPPPPPPAYHRNYQQAGPTPPNAPNPSFYAGVQSSGDHATRTRTPTNPQSLPSGPKSGPAPVPTHSRQLSGSSQKGRSARENIRKLQISGPIPKASFPEPQDQYQEMDTRTPMSPHYIPTNPGRPPLPPSDSRAETPIDDETDEDNNADPFVNNEKDEDSIIHAYGGDDIDRPPSARSKQGPARIPKLSITTTTPPQTSGSDLPLRQQQPTHATPPSAGAATNTLPFRAIHPPQPISPSRPPQAYHGVSPGPMKTTFLSPRRDRFLPGGMNPIGPGGVPNSAALLSAGLATPYSPYMPFSPMTPVTPHLTNRHERRAQEREEGRAAATEADRVQNDDELWGDTW